MMMEMRTMKTDKEALPGLSEWVGWKWYAASILIAYPAWLLGMRLGQWLAGQA